MAIEWLPVGAGIAKVLFRAGWQKDTLTSRNKGLLHG